MYQFLYGPPGSGKTTIGKKLAESLKLPFTDLDEVIENYAGKQIPEIFAQEGEAGFREREHHALSEVITHKHGVIALGGGALLNTENRILVEKNGQVVCLRAPLETLFNRLQASQTVRPLLGREETVENKDGLYQRLRSLMESRGAHYNSFSRQLNTDNVSSDKLVEAAQQLFGAFRVSGMGSEYDVRVILNGLKLLGFLMKERGLRGPVALVSDENVGDYYAQQIVQVLETAGYEVKTIIIPAGEAFKTISTIGMLWKQFLEAGIERGSTVIALGGGVVGDLVGFAAATLLRGVPWVVVPTSLLAMVDASLGGKTGADLPEGKNLIGAFYPPKLVLVDPITLNTLPEDELRSGLAEVVKAGIIGDPKLFSTCKSGWEAIEANWDQVIREAMAVKIDIIQEDPFEKDRRASLNLGHTIGHAVEKVSAYRIRHGEAVAVGMVAEAQLGEFVGITDVGLAGEIESVLHKLNLPTKLPGDLDRHALLGAMRVDKKKARGRVLFSLPVRVGDVLTGVNIPNLESLFMNL